MLFTGSMRVNLDPFEQFNDAECWQALRRANLAGLVESAPAGLDMQLSAGGAPLSAGQKQLVALARALLKRSKAGPGSHPSPSNCASGLVLAVWGVPHLCAGLALVSRCQGSHARGDGMAIPSVIDRVRVCMRVRARVRA